MKNNNFYYLFFSILCNPEGRLKNKFPLRLRKKRSQSQQNISWNHLGGKKFLSKKNRRKYTKSKFGKLQTAVKIKTQKQQYGNLRKAKKKHF